MRRDVATMDLGQLAQAATDSTGGRIGVAAVGVVIGVLPGSYMLYRMSRKKTREASTTDLTDVRGFGWSSLSQKIAFTVGGFALTLLGLGIVALALWLPKGTTVSSHENRRGGVSLSSPWAWVLIGLLTRIQGADDAVVADADVWVSKWPRSAWRAGPLWAC